MGTLWDACAAGRCLANYTTVLTPVFFIQKTELWEGERERERNRGRQRDLPSADAFRKWPQWLDLGQESEASNESVPKVVAGTQGLGPSLAAFSDTLAVS